MKFYETFTFWCFNLTRPVYKFHLDFPQSKHCTQTVRPIGWLWVSKGVLYQDLSKRVTKHAAFIEARSVHWNTQNLLKHVSFTGFLNCSAWFSFSVTLVSMLILTFCNWRLLLVHCYCWFTDNWNPLFMYFLIEYVFTIVCFFVEAIFLYTVLITLSIKLKYRSKFEYTFRILCACSCYCKHDFNLVKKILHICL